MHFLQFVNRRLERNWHKQTKKACDATLSPIGNSTTRASHLPIVWWILHIAPLNWNNSTIERKLNKTLITQWINKIQIQTWNVNCENSEWQKLQQEDTNPDGGSPCQSACLQLSVFLCLQSEHAAQWHMSDTHTSISQGCADRLIYFLTDAQKTSPHETGSTC